MLGLFRSLSMWKSELFNTTSNGPESDLILFIFLTILD